MSDVEHELRMYDDPDPVEPTPEELDRLFVELNTPPLPPDDDEPLPDLDGDAIPF